MSVMNRACFLASFGLAAFVALPESPAAAGAVVSPSQVLQRADDKLGSQGVDFGRPSSRPLQLATDDKTLAPYFYVAGGDPETETLPLKETSARVEIAGVIARVQVRQVFENGGQKPIEAVYVFPASTRAAVHGMRMRIGERTIEAKIEKKLEARAQYESAKRQGKRASLLEQERPNVFTMNVANVMPKDRIEVELDYSELLVPEDAVYEFVYPTVVGPRYGGGADPKKDKWIANPYQHAGQKEPYKFDIRVHVESGIGLKEISSPSHSVEIAYRSPASADVSLKSPGGGNKDFILRYRLAGGEIDAGLLLYKGDKENFFIVQMEPPRRPSPSQIPPREYIFLLDVSGSMHGFPLDTAKALAKKLLGRIRPTDLLNVAMFSGGSFVLSPEGSIPATPGNIQLATEIIDRQRGGGGTELMGGLRAAYGIPRHEEGIARTVVVVTDGYVGVEAQAFKFIRQNANMANLFAFGIGSSVNRGLIEGMARAGQGEPFVVLSPDKAQEEADRLATYIESPVLTQISVRFPGFGAYEVAPMQIPDLLASRPLILFGKYRGEPTGKVEVTGFTGGGRFTRSLPVTATAAKKENAPIRWLWARRWVALLDDELNLGHAEEIEEAITDLGLAYNLLTTFTSFVAVDSEVVNKGGRGDKVDQPLPMPEGVSDLAVGEKKEEVAAHVLGKGTLSPAPMAAPFPAVAEPSRPHMSRGKRVFSNGLARPAARRADSDSKSSGQQKWLIAEAKATALSDTGALFEALEARLQGDGCRAAGASATIRLTVDKAGKIVKVEIVKASDENVGVCLKKTLSSLSSDTKAVGAASGTLVVTIRAVQI